MVPSSVSSSPASTNSCPHRSSRSRRRRRLKLKWWWQRSQWRPNACFCHRAQQFLLPYLCVIIHSVEFQPLLFRLAVHCILAVFGGVTFSSRTQSNLTDWNEKVCVCAPILCIRIRTIWWPLFDWVEKYCCCCLARNRTAVVCFNWIRFIFG